jgi:general stress protein YciG
MGKESTRGFASFSGERVKELASKGGKEAHRLGRGHQWTTEQAREAGRKGGAAVAARKGHMSAIGRKGGAVSAAMPGRMSELGKKGGAAIAKIRGGT